VVTVCDRAKEQCPIFPGAGKVLSWSFDDPAAARGSHAEQLAAFRRVRDEIAERIRSEFLPAAASRA
jgi:arsenate reductase